MVDPTVFARTFAAGLVIVALGVLWPLRYLWIYPLVIILLGIVAVTL